MRTQPRPDKRSLPRWARTVVVVYLLVTVAAVGAALLINAFDFGPNDAFRDGLRLAMIVLTLPVSAAYFVVGTLSSSGAPPSGGLSPTAVIYYLGYVGLAVVNAALFRWTILRIRKPVPAAGEPVSWPQDLRMTVHGVTRYVRHLRWVVPLAVLLSLPQWAVASLAWCGISGCSGGGFGVSTGTEWLAITLSIVNGFILAVAVFAVPWLYPTGRRALIALAAGALFGLVGAAVTHG